MPRSMTASELQARNAMFDIFMTGVDVKIHEAISEKTTAAVNELTIYLDSLKNEIKQHKHLTISTEHETVEIKELVHEKFPDLLKLCLIGFPVMIVGTAGSGKTFAASQVAHALSRPFYAVSVGSQTSKLDLLGYRNATGDYVRTSFREAYEHGGLFLMDEIDAGNPNVLIVLNSALSSSFCSFPDGMIERHEDFLFVGTANTYGTGASRQYVGRNQIDAATLDRFTVLDWPVDEKLERSLVEHFPHGLRWQAVVRAVRSLAEERAYRVVVSPRATLKGASLLHEGFPFDEVVKMTILPTATIDQREPLLERAQATWGGKSV